VACGSNPVSATMNAVRIVLLMSAAPAARAVPMIAATDAICSTWTNFCIAGILPIALLSVRTLPRRRFTLFDVEVEIHPGMRIARVVLVALDPGMDDDN